MQNLVPSSSFSSNLQALQMLPNTSSDAAKIDFELSTDAITDSTFLYLFLVLFDFCFTIRIRIVYW